MPGTPMKPSYLAGEWRDADALIEISRVIASRSDEIAGLITAEVVVGPGLA